MKNKFKKLLSIVLLIAVVLSVCGVFGVFTPSAQTQDTGSIRDYYVRYDGAEYSDTDEYGTIGTVDNPYKTVYDAVAAVNADATFNAAGNTFNVWVMQDIEAIANMDENVTVGGVAYATHNMVSWAKAGTTETMSSYKAKMVVKPYANNVGTTYLAFSTLAGSADPMYINGPTEFDNVKLVMTSSDYNRNIADGRINCNGNNVKFGSVVTYGYVNVTKASAISWDGTVKDTDTIITDIVDVHDSETAKVIEDAFEVEFENEINGIDGYTGFPTVKGNANFNFKNDVTIAVTGAPYYGRLSLGGSGNTYASVLDKNLNLRLTGSTSNFEFAENSSLIVKGGIQVIKSSSFSGSSVTYAGITALNLYATEEKSAKAPIWFINVDKSAKNYIDFVEGETGKFKVPADAVAVATHKDGTTKESENGILDLSEKSGEYTVSITVKTYDYYVKGGATGTGMSKDSPAGSVAEAIAAMKNNGGLTAVDTANIWIMQNDMTDITCASNMTHNMAYWGAYTEHDATVNINAYEGNTYSGDVITNTLLSLASTINSDETLKFGGPTVIGNVQLVYNSVNNFNVESKDILNFNGKDVTIGADAKFAYIDANGNTVNDDDEKYSSAGWPSTVTKHFKEASFFNAWVTANTGDAVTYSNPINITFNRGFSTTSDKSRLLVGASNDIFNEDVNIILDAKSNGYNARVRLGYGSYSSSFNKNLNFKIISSDLFGFDPEKNITVNGAMQLILSDTATFFQYNPYTNFDDKAFKSDGSAADSWILKVPAEDINNVNFIQGEKGKFIAYKPNCTAAAYDADNNLIKEANENNIIDLSATTGEYTIKFTEKIVHVENHDLDSYINYRGYNTAVTKNNGALANASKKLATEKELNVVYFGGSVTAGSGSTNNGSWRGRISDWLTKSFPTVKVNNYDQAIGETGTYLGCYRVVRDIVSKAPDILFIEYSINDFYDNASDARTSMQFETIVRNVKEAYPDCDIVTVLVTDVYVADEAANGILHPQAAVHEEISTKYNISTLHVGRYLATTLKDEGCTFSSSADAVWAKYFDDAEGDHDIVHPNNKGYDLYYQVVNAFMTNCLVFGDSSNYAVQNQVLPEMVNKYLFDGEVTYIDESDVTFTTEGGTTLSPDMQGIVYPDYQGLIRVPAGSQDVITVEFNGTELIMLSRSGHAEKAGNNYLVRIDGGEWVEYAYQGKNPIVIASGLVGGDHVAEIKVSPAKDVFGNGTDYLISGFYSRNVEKATNRLSILDLVAIDETIDDTSLDYRDFNNDHVININDIATLKKILLNNR